MRRRIIEARIAWIILIAGLAVVFIFRFLKSSQVYWPAGEWRTSTPEEQGFDSKKLADQLLALKERNVPINSLLIIRNGYLFLDAYFAPYVNSIPHDLASVTKSVTATLIGIAVEQGKLELDQPIVSFFPDRVIANLDEWKERITIRHLLSHSAGMSSGCMNMDEPTLNAMRSQRDWVQAALDRKMVNEPGTTFCYDSPGMHLLSAILQEATGMTEFDFAKQYLFTPLGIQESYWQTDPQGFTHGWGDLHLKPPDAAKLGYLWLNQGIWDGKQIISASFFEQAVQPLYNGGADSYGYGFWISDDNFTAMGRGGQLIRIYPAYNAVIVTTGGGITFESIEPLLSAAFIDLEKALPANAEGVDHFEAVLSDLAQTSSFKKTDILPDIAKQVSGKLYLIEPNPVEITALRFDFSDPTQAALEIIKSRGDGDVWVIGMDGEYRISSDGQAARGYWADPSMFTVEVFDFSSLETYVFKYSDDSLEVNSPALGFMMKGRMENEK